VFGSASAGSVGVRLGESVMGEAVVLLRLGGVIGISGPFAGPAYLVCRGPLHS
jgi:hypothetical protein